MWAERTSQILQAVGIKYAVEHWRRHMPRCMGALYWQLNDCWPVASWSSVPCECFSARTTRCGRKRTGKRQHQNSIGVRPVQRARRSADLAAEGIHDANPLHPVSVRQCQRKMLAVGNFFAGFLGSGCRFCQGGTPYPLAFSKQGVNHHDHEAGIRLAVLGPCCAVDYCRHPVPCHRDWKFRCFHVQSSETIH